MTSLRSVTVLGISLIDLTKPDPLWKKDFIATALFSAGFVRRLLLFEEINAGGSQCKPRC